MTGLYSYGSYKETTAVPEPLQDSGKVRLYFDRPGISATMTASVRDDSSEDNPLTSYDYLIDINAPQTVRSLRFYLLLSSGSRAITTFPSGRPLEQHNGCFSSIYFIPDVESECQEIRGAPDAVSADPSATEPLQLLSGLMRRNDAGFMFTTVLLSTESKVQRTAGSRTYYRFPSIGTSYIPEEGRSRPWDFGTGQEMFYVPTSLILGISGRSIQDNERIESVSTDLDDPGKLSWVDDRMTSMTARGSLVDVSVEAHSGRNLFFLGILLSLTATVLLNLIRALLVWSGLEADALGL